jgi:hypothetical protein
MLAGLFFYLTLHSIIKFQAGFLNIISFLSQHEHEFFAFANAMSKSLVAKFYISGRGSPVHLLCREKMIRYVQHAEKVQRKEHLVSGT